MALIEVENLAITFKTQKGEITPVRGITFNLEEGESLGVVGESGSGKSLTNLAIMGLLPPNAIVTADKLLFNGQDLLNLSDFSWQKIRGEKMAMIFQDAMTALNPCYNVEFQIQETLKIHTSLNRKERLERCIHLLDLVGIADPNSRLKSFPHELSGGMAQRVMIAIALACNPKVLIADEPTTALDVTIQDQILKLITEIQEKNKMALILVTHDIGVVSEFSKNIQVMYAGEIVEKGPTKEIIKYPRHPYTQGLLNSRPGHSVIFRERLPSISGLVPDMRQRPLGCQFRPRCTFASENCERPIELYPSQFAFEKNRSEHNSTMMSITTPSVRQIRCIHPLEGERNA